MSSAMSEKLAKTARQGPITAQWISCARASRSTTANRCSGHIGSGASPIRSAAGRMDDDVLGRAHARHHPRTIVKDVTLATRRWIMDTDLRRPFPRAGHTLRDKRICRHGHCRRRPARPGPVPRHVTPCLCPSTTCNPLCAVHICKAACPEGPRDGPLGCAIGRQRTRCSATGVILIPPTPALRSPVGILCYALVTRQMTSPTSSAISKDALSGPIVTPTGRP